MYNEFINSLTAPQVRALSCQIGCKTWATSTVKFLRDLMIYSQPSILKAKAIWEKHYAA